LSDRVEDELAIRRVLAAYCHRIDDGDLGAVADLFTTDGCFAFGRQEASGRAALVAWFEENHPPERRGKHMSVNPVIEIDADAATVESDFAFVRWIDGALTTEAVGRYRDTFARIDGRWRIERRDVAMMKPPR
jgi:uncharacterized protein (TIGR02246 family)